MQVLYSAVYKNRALFKTVNQEDICANLYDAVQLGCPDLSGRGPQPLL